MHVGVNVIEFENLVNEDILLAAEENVDTYQEPLSISFERFLDLEQVPDASYMKQEDEYVMKLLESRIVLKDGHLELPIPYKFLPPTFPDNRKQAAKRLDLLGKRLKRDNELCEKYMKTMGRILITGLPK